MKTRFTIILQLLLITIIVQAQITYTAIPKDLQLIPRDNLNKGNFTISGTSSYVGYGSLRTKIINNNTAAVVEDKITTINANGSFSVQHQITAQLAEYNIQVFIKNGTAETLVTTISNIVCGDVFIVNGQSNALTPIDDTNGGTQQNASYRNTYCRGLGYNFPIATGNQPPPNDLLWSRPSSIWWESGYIGAWALKLQNDLAIETNVPSCFVNGAVGGTFISEHYATNTPSNPSQLNLSKIYDRLYRKLKENNLTTSVKAIFWYQGEADASLSACDAGDYSNRFNRLYNSWKQDYPNFKKIFLFQINTGCTDNNGNGGLIRDIQRNLPNQYLDVEVIATVGSSASDRNSDGCHYIVAGYNKLADKIKPLVKKSVYGISVPASSYSPKLLKAYFTTSTQLCLEFDNNVSSQPPLTVNGSTYNLKDFFYGENNTQLTVQSLSVSANKLYLNLANTSLIPKVITYLPNSTYSNGSTYVGPWIMDATNWVGALTFREFPIRSSTAYNNGWDLVNSNYNSGSIGGWSPLPADKYIPGDFDGNGTQELLAVQSNANAWSTMLNYQNNTWNWGWSNYGNNAISGWQLAPTDLFYAGNFDGVAGDELLCAAGGGTYVALLKFVSGNWTVLWSNGGNVNNDFFQYRNNLVIGDFNGDGKADAVGSNGDMIKMFSYVSNDFVSVWNSGGSTSHTLYAYRTNLRAGDYNGDGKTDLLGMNGSWATTFYYNTSVSGSWQFGESTYGGNTAFGGWGLPALSADNFLVGNLDTDAKDEVFCIQGANSGAWATTVSTNSTGGFSPGWTNSGNGYIHDWAVSETGGSNTKYVMIKPTASSKKYLLAMRLYGNCGRFLVNMYQTNTTNNYRPLAVDEEKSAIDNHIAVYPNPASDEFKIAYSLSKAGEVKVSLYNIAGQLIKEAIVSGTQGMNELPIDVSDVAKGMYIIHIEKENTFFTEKLSVQH